MSVIYFVLICSRYTSCVYRQSIWDHVRVHIFNRTINDVPKKSLAIKTEHTPNDVVRLVNKCSCLAYDWMVNDEYNVT